MEAFTKIVTWPFAKLILFFYNLTGNYGLAMIVFALAVRLIMLPFQMKSKRSTMRSARIEPLRKELEIRHGANKQKYQEEVTKLYKEEKINPMSGCLWGLIPFPIMIALYSVVRQPLTRIMELTADQITKVSDTLVSVGAYIIPEKASSFVEVELANLIHKNFEAVKAVVPEVVNFDFSFLGMNLGQIPQLTFFRDTDWGNPAVWGPALGLFLIPLVSAFFSYLQMKISMANSISSPAADQAAGSMKSMTITMPLISAWMGYTMPAAMAVYWACGYIFTIPQDILLNRHYKKVLDKEDEIRNAARAAQEAELERKRAETERLRAEGATQRNPATSKKRIQTTQKMKQEERAAAANAAKKAESDEEASRVGNRRYARGRAYDPDRFEGLDAIDGEVVEELEADESFEGEPLVLEDAAPTGEEGSAAEVESDESSAEGADTDIADEVDGTLE